MNDPSTRPPRGWITMVGLMDFGGYIVLFVWAMALVVGLVVIVVLHLIRSSWRTRLSIAWLVSAACLGLFAWHLSRVALDESLWGAARQGNASEVRRLLSEGASPNATWESGQSAIEAAKENGHEEIVSILREAGARE